MKRFTASLAATLVLVMGIQAQAVVKYWDRYDNNPGALDPSNMTTFGDGAWNLTDANWNLNSDGSGANTTWTNGDDAVFSAGMDLVGLPLFDAAISVATPVGTVTANSILIEEGVIQVQAGAFDAPQITVNPNAALRSIASSQFTGGGKLTLKGTSTTDAGEFRARNTGNAGSMINNSAAATAVKSLEIDGFGRISYDDGDGIADNKVSIMSNNVITGVGGTPTNGGTGTLIKSGPDQIGYAVKDTGGGVMNFTLNSFAKLRVEQGGFRLRNTGGVIDERLFGAEPLAVLPDAITLDGGGIGSNATVTLHANRGVTIGPNGGYFDHGALAGLIIPGPLSGSGTLAIGDPTSTATGQVTFTLSNAGNTSTFSGGIVGHRGVLQLNSSLSVASLVDGNTTNQPTNASTINVATGNTLTSNGAGTWSTVIGGAGGFTKAGTGTQTLAGINTYGGDTKVEGGTLSISNAYLADAADVYVSTGGIFDLTFAGTDTIDQLFLNGTPVTPGIWGSAASGAANQSALFTGSGTLTVTTGAVVGVPGDYNNNGTVDSADYVVWKNGGPLQNEVAGITPGSVTPEDYDAWRARFGNNSGSGSSQGGAIPEPTSIILVFAGLVGLTLTSRRSR